MRCTKKSQNRKPGIILICDFRGGLLDNILSVYRQGLQNYNVWLFRKRAGGVFDAHRFYHHEIPISVETLERGFNATEIIFASIKTIFYILYLLIQAPSMKQKNIKIVHSRFLVPQGLAGIMISRILKVPHVVTVEGSDINRYKKNALYSLISKEVMKNSSAIIAVSFDIEKKLKAEYKNVEAVFNAIDTNRFIYHRETESFSNILFVGNLFKNKRPDVLIRAIGLSVEKGYNVNLSLAGEGPMEQELRKLVDSLDLNQHVTFLGYQRKMEYVFKKHSIFVLPSASEGLSFALLEAMASGLVCIVSDIPGNTNIIEDGKDGIVFKLDNAEELSEKIICYISNPKKAEELGRNARNKIEEEYSLDTAISKIENIYRRETIEKNNSKY